MLAPRAANERERLEALRGLNILDTPPEENFDRIAALAKAHFRVPIVLISFVDETREWFKSHPGTAVKEASPENAFCTHTILSDEPLIVTDPAGDPRFQKNPMVAGEPGIRFYAGSPLVLKEGHRVGAICLMDTARREEFGAEEAAVLREYAALVTRELEIRKALARTIAAEEQTRTSEANYKNVLATAPYGIYRTSPEGRVLSVNPAVLEMLGYESFEELARRNIESEGLVTERSRFKETLESAGAVEDYETIWRRKDGSPVHVREDARVVRSETGEVLYYEGTVIDISARRMAEEQRRQVQSLVEKIVNTLPTVLYLLELPQHNCVYVNPQIENMLGYTPDEFEGAESVLARFAHPDDAARILKHHEAFGEMHDGEIREIAGRLRHKDGGWRWFRTREAVFSRDGDGNPTQILGAAMDFTAQHAMEQRIRLQEERWNLALAANNDGIFDWDLESGEAFRSARCLEIFGYPNAPENGPVKDWKRAVHEGDLSRVESAIERYLARVDAAFEVEYRIRTQGSEVRWILSRAQGQWDEDGKPIRLVGSVSDITARKHTEIAVRLQADWLAEARDRAEAATNAKSRFLATMSHEIRTPLNAILGMTNLLLESRLSKEQVENAETIRSSSATLLALVEDILDFSKIEAGRMELEAIEFQLPELVEEGLDLLAQQAEAKGLELLVWIDPHVPKRVIGDGARLRQIMLNLLSNAVKFTPSGEVMVNVQPKSRAGGAASVVFSVTDTGIGISPEAQQHLFESFSQADSSTTRRFGGTGLGLAISKQLVQLMGGEIGVESQLGEGSRFWFEIPFEIASEGPAEPGPDLTGRVALVVDDNANGRNLIRRHLEQLGCASLLCGSAAEALKVLKGTERPVDFAMIDATLPAMDGAALATKIRALGAYRHLPVVLLRARDRRRFPRKQPARANLFLLKPIRRRSLRSVVSQALGIEAPVAAGNQPQSHPGNGNGVRVLLAEDNRANQRVAMLMLERLGYAVDVAANGLEAIEAYRRTRYPLILMDCQMPEMDGIDATREIRQMENGGHRTVIIALTANALAEDRNLCLAAGMDDYLVKPVLAELLREKLERWLAARARV